MSDNNFVLQIRNYQRIKNAKLEFVPGLNVIQGQSNNGKTAVFRAIQTAIFNLSRESHVTLGETKSAVGIKYRGHEVIWRRDNNAPSPMSYRVDGKILTKLGRGQPKIISEMTGIREVELDDMKIKLNFQKQMEYPFLLDKTPSQLFKFIVQSAEEDNVMDVIQTMKTDLNTIGVNVKAYEEARESLRIAAQREIKRYKDKSVVVPYCDRVLAMESKVKRYNALKELVDSAKACIQSIADNTQSLEKVVEVYEKVSLCVETAQSSYDRSISLDKDIGVVLSVEESKILLEKKLKEVSIVLDQFKGVDEVSDKIGLLEKKQVLKDKLSRFLSQLEEAISRYESFDSKYQRVSKEQTNTEEMLSRIGSAIDFYEETSAKVSEIESLVSEIEDCNFNLSSKKEQMEKLMEQMNKIEEEIGTYDICPFCGSNLGGEDGEHHEH